jgi:glycosyltransferase involved in cell wall biosynthesis
MYTLTTTCRFGGVETFVWEASRELARRGEEVHILGGRGDRRENIPNLRILLFPFWNRERIPDFGRRFRKLLERLSMGFFSLRTLQKEKYDILHIHKPFDLPLGAWVKKRVGSKLILGSHGTDFFGGDRVFARAVDGAVSCSCYNGNLLYGRYGFKPDIIYNGIEPGRFQPFPAADAELMNRYGLSAEDFVIIYVGRLIGLKGVKTLLKAAATIPKKYRVKILLAGDGEERIKLEELSRRLNLEREVLFAGFVPHQEIPRHYSISRLAVFPSVADEAFGISVCEAMACGLPTIGTRVGGIPEIIEDGRTGFLVAPREEEELAGTIEKLILDPRLCRKVGKRAVEWVSRVFTWERVVDRLMGVYKRVMIS